MDPEKIKDIKEILEIFEKADIEELELEKEGMKIRLKKSAKHLPATTESDAEREPSGGNNLGREKPDKEKSKGDEEDKSLIQIKAPMVGTFYGSASPDSKPFVEVGSEIQEDDVVCIIEAMKLMNEIKSEVKGSIVKILVENGQPVQYGQLLFLIKI